MPWYWGDLHNHCAISYGHGSLARALAIARQQLDFCAITGHAFWPDLPDDPPDDPGRYAHTRAYHLAGFAKLRAGWDDVQRQMAKARELGKFETFLSYEWHSCTDGDHHVVYCGDHGPLLGGERIGDLKAALKAAHARGEAPPALAIPHHIGYGAGYRGINWETYTPDLSPFVEIYSLHGCAESDDAPYPMLHRMGPRDGRATAAWGLAHGRRFGLVASTDHHSGYPGSYGYGRLAASATELTREALWDAFLARRVYAATGDKIALDFQINGAPMGSELPPVPRREITVDVRGRGAVDYVELLKNERVLHHWPGPDPNRAVDYAGAGRSGSAVGFARVAGAAGDNHRGAAGAVRALVRIEWGWGADPIRWECQLALDNGHIVDVETCFAGPAVVAPQDDFAESDDLPHELIEARDSRCAWRSQTEPNPTVRHSATQALIAEVEMPPGASLTLTANGQRYRHTLASLLEASSSHFLRGWRSEAIVLHRALPVDLARVHETLVDDIRGGSSGTGARGGGVIAGTGQAGRGVGAAEADCYRVRVAQRNGQWAWSSPIWVGR